MKKFKTCVLAVLAAGLLLLPGCSKSETSLDPDNPTSVIVWHYYKGTQKTAFDELVSKFNETVGAEEGIVVTAESKGSVDDLAEAVAASANQKVGSEELPNIFATYSDTAYVVNELGLLADIKQYITDEELGEYVEGFIQEGEFTDGSLYIFPVAKSTELLFVDMTDWNKFAEETGATDESFKTWEGLAEVSKQYYDWSGGKAFFGRDAFANYLIVGSRQLGSELFEVNNGQVTLNLDRDVMRRLWDNYAEPYIKGYYGAYGRFRSDDVKTGDLIAVVGSTSSTSYYPTEVTIDGGITYNPIEGKVYPVPGFKGTEDYAVQQGAGMAVTKGDTLSEKASVEFLKWFTDVEQNTDFCVSSGYIPVKYESNTRENLEAALQREGVDKDSLVYDSFLLGVDTVNNVNLYTNRPFDGGVEARGVLTEFMTDKIDNYKAELEGLSGDELDTALDSAFESWLTELSTALENC